MCAIVFAYTRNNNKFVAVANKVLLIANSHNNRASKQRHKQPNKQTKKPKSAISSIKLQQNPNNGNSQRIWPKGGANEKSSEITTCKFYVGHSFGQRCRLANRSHTCSKVATHQFSYIELVGTAITSIDALWVGSAWIECQCLPGSRFAMYSYATSPDCAT